MLSVKNNASGLFRVGIASSILARGLAEVVTSLFGCLLRWESGQTKEANGVRFRRSRDGTFSLSGPTAAYVLVCLLCLLSFSIVWIKALAGGWGVPCVPCHKKGDRI